MNIDDEFKQLKKNFTLSENLRFSENHIVLGEKLFNRINGKVKINIIGIEDINTRKLSLQGNIINNFRPVDPYMNLCLKKCLKFLFL